MWEQSEAAVLFSLQQWLLCNMHCSTGKPPEECTFISAVWGTRKNYSSARNMQRNNPKSLFLNLNFLKFTHFAIKIKMNIAIACKIFLWFCDQWKEEKIHENNNHHVRNNCSSKNGMLIYWQFLEGCYKMCLISMFKLIISLL